MTVLLEDQDGPVIWTTPPEVTEHVVTEALAEARQRGEDDQIAAHCIDTAETAATLVGRVTRNALGRRRCIALALRYRR